MSTVLHQVIERKVDQSITNTNNKNILKQGWVYKKSKHLKQYHKRFIQLKRNKLVCYTTNKLEKAAEIFDLSLHSYKVDTNTPIKEKFYLIDSNGNSRTFKTESESERNDWVQQIRNVCNSTKIISKELLSSLLSIDPNRYIAQLVSNGKLVRTSQFVKEFKQIFQKHNAMICCYVSPKSRTIPYHSFESTHFIHFQYNILSQTNNQQTKTRFAYYLLPLKYDQLSQMQKFIQHNTKNHKPSKIKKMFSCQADDLEDTQDESDMDYLYEEFMVSKPVLPRGPSKMKNRSMTKEDSTNYAGYLQKILNSVELLFTDEIYDILEINDGEIIELFKILASIKLQKVRAINEESDEQIIYEEQQEVIYEEKEVEIDDNDIFSNPAKDIRNNLSFQPSPEPNVDMSLPYSRVGTATTDIILDISRTNSRTDPFKMVNKGNFRGSMVSLRDHAFSNVSDMENHYMVMMQKQEDVSKQKIQILELELKLKQMELDEKENERLQLQTVNQKQRQTINELEEKIICINEEKNNIVKNCEAKYHRLANDFYQFIKNNNSNNQNEHENDFKSNNVIQININNAARNIHNDVTEIESPFIQNSFDSMFIEELSLYENKYGNNSKLNEQTISDMEQIIDEEISINNSVPGETTAINDESVTNQHRASIIYYLAGENEHTTGQNNSQKSHRSNNSQKANSNSSNNNSDKTNDQSSNNGSNMSGSSGGDNGGDGNGRKDRNNDKNNGNNNNLDDDDEEENPEKDDEENEEDDQKDNDVDTTKLNPMAAEYSPMTRKRSMTLSTINEQTPLRITDSIQSAASVPVFVHERKEETNVKSNRDQYANNRQNKKKKKKRKKQLTFKQRKELKLQQMYTRVNNEPYFHKIETAKQNVYISQKLIRNIQTKTAITMDNIRNYMNSVFEIHYQDKCESELKILDFGFVDKETKEALYCSLTPQNHSYDRYKLNDSLKLIKSLSSTHKFKSINIDHTNNIINAMKKVNTENILKNCDWDKIPIICRKDDKLRITASVTKEQLVIREKRFNANQINLIPIIGYNTKQVSFVWIIKIDTHIYIALSLGFEQQNNGINDITINGVYLDKSDLLIRHYLAYPPHMNECKCLNEFESIIDDINIGNPDLWFNKIKHYRASRKNNTNASYHHELKASMFETESEDSHNAIKRNSSSNSIVSSVSISKSTPNSSSVSSYDQQIMYQKSMISNDFYVNQTTANVPYIYVSTPIIPDMYNNNNNHHYHVFQHPHANNLYTNKNHFSNNSL
eukprot:157966_1